MSATPGALQLRLLQTVVDVAADHAPRDAGTEHAPASADAAVAGPLEAPRASRTNGAPVA